MFYYKTKNRTIKLEIPESVYEPREDSVLLAKVLEDKLKNKNIKTVLEIGCGSGLLSIIASEYADVTAIDINEKSVNAAGKNAEINKAKINCFCSDLFENIKGGFDLIIFNPPYLPDKISDNSRTWAAGRNLEVIKKFAFDAKAHLNEKGKILLVASSLTPENKVIKIFESCGFKTKIIAEEKIPFEKLFVLEIK